MKRIHLLMLGCVILSILGYLGMRLTASPEETLIPYSTFRAHIADGDCTDVTITKDRIRGTPKHGGTAWVAELPTDVNEELIVFLDDHRTTYRVEYAAIDREIVMTGVSLLSIVFLLLTTWGIRRTLGGPAKTWNAVSSNTAFADVAGCEEAKQELEETVIYLKDPKRAARLGAKNPRGVLLCGPPGTGKTLLARAVAGEAGVPFYSVSGSEFVEMFVGAGAARVRKLFRKAKRHAPAIIFIDEIDAVGGARGGQNDHSEREQTLNQILVEMDGFERTEGLIIMAATNRTEHLDAALVRKGRFDRRITVDLPDVQARHAILTLHAKSRTMDAEVDLLALAQQLSGFSGADLANVINEGALVATRENAPMVTQTHLQAAIERVLAGAERKTRRLRPEERSRVAHHEAGHAIIRAITSGPKSVQKVSIVPRGEALGITIQIPPEDRYLVTDRELLDGIAGLLGGRAAEELMIGGSISTGASDDLAEANSAARRYVTLYGMAPTLRHLAFERVDPKGRMAWSVPSISQRFLALADREVFQCITKEYARATELLRINESLLREMASALLDREHLSGRELHAFLDRVVRDAPTSAASRNGGPSTGLVAPILAQHRKEIH
ncbi:ATP-dependent zinc metalloprotease FtsH [Candidatus Uhrbacteria bacterium]|nr:ATP-dependent zinc metalloprotease FtsH [Candidatus Uhrbacteria bacterium]